MLLDLHPHRRWDLSQFNVVPKRHWSQESNQRDFLKNLERKLNINQWKDWYSVDWNQIRKKGSQNVLILLTYVGGSNLMTKFNFSPSNYLMKMYPELPWDLRQFKKVPQNYWKVDSNRRDAMDDLEKKLNILDWKDWYQITKQEIEDSGTL